MANKNAAKNLGQYLGKSPGRPKGSVNGRKAALAVLDDICANAENQKLLKDQLTKEFRKCPGKFWKDFIQPNLPKTAELDLTGKVTLVWDMPTE